MVLGLHDQFSNFKKHSVLVLCHPVHSFGVAMIILETPPGSLEDSSSSNTTLLTLNSQRNMTFQCLLSQDFTCLGVGVNLLPVAFRCHL